jgi:hypothetical protein
MLVAMASLPAALNFFDRQRRGAVRKSADNAARLRAQQPTTDDK